MKILKDLKINNESKKINASEIAVADESNKFKTLDNKLASIDDNITSLKSIKLWENPNPNVAFSGQDITLSSDDYDYLIWFCIWYTGISQIRLVSYTTLKGYGTYLNGAGDYTPNNSQYYTASFIREVNRNSDTSFSVSDCFVRYGNSTSRPTQNVTLVPLAIYGGKF